MGCTDLDNAGMGSFYVLLVHKTSTHLLRRLLWSCRDVLWITKLHLTISFACGWVDIHRAFIFGWTVPLRFCWNQHILSIHAHTVGLTEVSALWLLKITLPNGSEVPEMSLGAKSLRVSPDQKTSEGINTLQTSTSSWCLLWKFN